MIDVPYFPVQLYTTFKQKSSKCALIAIEYLSVPHKNVRKQPCHILLMHSVFEFLISVFTMNNQIFKYND